MSDGALPEWRFANSPVRCRCGRRLLVLGGCLRCRKPSAQCSCDDLTLEMPLPSKQQVRDEDRLVAEAEHRYQQDPIFHTRVHMAVGLAQRRFPEALARETDSRMLRLAASIALVLGDSG